MFSGNKNLGHIDGAGDEQIWRRREKCRRHSEIGISLKGFRAGVCE
jgi:hypothetical protein